MSTFTYEAYDSKGTLVRGEFEAAGKGEVLDHLFRHSLKPLSIRPLRGPSLMKLNISFGKSITRADVLFLVRNLAATMKAGMSLSESLDVLTADTERPYLRTVLQRVQADVQNGRSLSDAFATYQSSFPPAFVGMIRAGELSGQLDKTLTLLGTYLTKEYQLRQQVRSALVYPVVLIAASIAVVALLLIVVLPRLASSFASSGIELPLVTRIFLGLSSALTYSIILDFLALVLFVGGIAYMRRTPRGRRFFFWLLSNMPIGKEVVRKVAIVRFARTFGNLSGAGISAIEALGITGDSLGNDVYRRALQKAEQIVEEGGTLSRALAERPELFPKVLVGMVIVGERTGSLGEVLVSLADFYEDEVQSKLKNLTATLEPLLLLVMGLVVGAIALSILLPIYQLIGKVS